MKQDRNGVRTAQDLEQKYDLASLVGLKKAVQQSEIGINKTNAELESFISETTESIDNIQSQIDGNITTYYYSGVPTLLNLPASEWDSTTYNTHLGDMYYDKDTGYAYRFYFDNTNNVYGWTKIVDSDATEALARANSAQDTADHKRRVFVVEPEPPYDNGDLWLNDGEIFVCQISKEESETYEVEDFIVATDYTDDTLAKEVENNLTVLQGSVTTIQTNQNNYKILIDTNTKTIDDNKKEIDNTIETMSYTFGTNELTIANSNDPTNARFNNQGVKVYTFNELNSIFNQNGTGVKKLIVTEESQIANLKVIKAIDENGDACTDFHHLISNVQDLSDLE